jgi:hypothetical protein
MSYYETIGELFNTDEILDKAFPQEVFAFFVKDASASEPCKIYKNIKYEYGKIIVETFIERHGEFEKPINVRGFSRQERTEMGPRTKMTRELHNALCASASRARLNSRYAF